MGRLILLRHGESCWNNHNLFTGWVDVPLSPKGIQEALEAGKRIRDLPIDIIYTSTLVRAQMTAFLAMSQHHSGKVPIVCHPEDHKLNSWGKIYSEEAKAHSIPIYYCWELNERMYGELQGLNKAETIQKYGPEQVKIWRRSYDTAPPNGESLKMTAARSLPFFQKEIEPKLKQGLSVLMPAHGNSIRSIMMYLDNLSKEEVVELEIPTGIPIIYDFQNDLYKKVL